MIAKITAQVSLLAFAATLLVGIAVQNAPVTVLTRALTNMLVAAVVAQIVAGAVKSVLREHLRARKSGLDHEHQAAINALNAQLEPVESGN
jgi:hypothetical protein